MSSSTLSCLIAGTLYLPDKSVLYGKPAALGSRHSSALEEITGSNQTEKVRERGSGCVVSDANSIVVPGDQDLDV